MKDYNFMKMPIFTLDDVKKEIKSESNLFATLKRMERDGSIFKLKSGLYSLVNPVTEDLFVNKFEIATAIHDDCYCAFHTALEYYGLVSRKYLLVQTISSHRQPAMTIQDYKYVTYVNKYDDGVEEHKDVSKIRVTNIERTILDCLDRPDLCSGLDEIYDAMGSIWSMDESKLLKYLNAYDKKILYKKAGYLFSQIKPKYLSESFYEICKSKMSLRDDDIRCGNWGYVYDSDWKVYASDPLIWNC